MTSLVLSILNGSSKVNNKILNEFEFRQDSITSMSILKLMDM